MASFPAFQFNIIVFAVHLAFNVAGPVVVCNVLLSHCELFVNVSENVGSVSIDNIKAMQRLPVCVCVCVEFCGFQRIRRIWSLVFLLSFCSCFVNIISQIGGAKKVKN